MFGATGDVYDTTPAGVMVGAGVQVELAMLNVEFGGNLSAPPPALLPTSIVAGVAGGLVTVSLTASIRGVETKPVQLAAAGQLASPPPATLALLVLELTAPAATVTGTVITILPTAAPVETTQLLIFGEPAAGHPVKVPPVNVIGPLVVMPVGNVSAIVIGAVVGLPDTAMVMV